MSDTRYEALFKSSGIAIWEEDFSRVLESLGKLPVSGSAALRTFFNEHPETVFSIIGKAAVIDVNPATVRLMGAGSKEELLGSVGRVVIPEGYIFVREELLALAEGRGFFEGETVNRTLEGETIDLLVTISFLYHDRNRVDAILTMLDITDRKRREKEKDEYLKEIEEKRILSETIRDITMVVTGEIKRERLLDSILEQVKRVVDFTTASIKTLDSDSIKFERALGYEKVGALEFMKNLCMTAEDYPLLQKAMESRKPVIIPDTYREKDWHIFPETSYIRSLILLPIFGTDSVYGFLSIENCHPNAYSEKDGEKLVPFARAIALAFKNSDLYERLNLELDQKEMLMREIHHRVKNNLALINSLISLHFDRNNDPRLNALMEHVRSKIYSISLVHEKLYDGGNLKNIELKEYYEDLLQELSRSYQEDSPVAVENSVEAGIVCDIDMLIPLGLILTELFINTVKYAEPPGEEKLVFSVFGRKRNGEVVLVIRDNGRGLPERYLDSGGPVTDFGVFHESSDTAGRISEAPGGLGLVLVGSLSGQIGGRARFIAGTGAVVEIVFPLD